MTIAEKNFWLTTVEAAQIPVRELPAPVPQSRFADIEPLPVLAHGFDRETTCGWS